MMIGGKCRLAGNVSAMCLSFTSWFNMRVLYGTKGREFNRKVILDASLLHS